MDKDKFEECLGKVMAEMEPADVESVANWPVVKALIIVSVVCAMAGLTVILAMPRAPDWLVYGAIGLEAISGTAGLLFLHYRWLGRSE